MLFRSLKNLTARQIRKIFPKFRGSKRFYNLKGTAGNYIGDITDPKILKKYPELVSDGRISVETVNGIVTNGKVPGEVFAAAIKASGHRFSGSADQFLEGLVSSQNISIGEARRISSIIDKEYFQYLNSSSGVGDSNNRYWSIANAIIKRELSDKIGRAHV